MEDFLSKAPLMQILTWLGKPELGVRVHDATIPRPTHAR